ncbi:Hypothetical predicted protein [Marmota monax]|uniref:Uncharacterized protein n=1 Tax=Marmota monax TaxID=9995 RepID=A0A5E4C3Y7_MARMO|nr:hypothetical protein GHT09_004569 [Marmota monax]VTJ75741.1 Hypothetical predicted protein [Marmota monax]
MSELKDGRGPQRPPGSTSSGTSSKILTASRYQNLSFTSDNDLLFPGSLSQFKELNC